MLDGVLSIITIYHKEGSTYTKYHKQASVRNTSMLKRSKIGIDEGDNATIRVFDVEGYGDTWECDKGDVIVSKKVNDTITTAPLTTLRKTYSKHQVFEVSSIEVFSFDTPYTDELEHVRIGAR